VLWLILPIARKPVSKIILVNLFDPIPPSPPSEGGDKIILKIPLLKGDARGLWQEDKIEIFQGFQAIVDTNAHQL
jgi:hypothetical protein